MDNSYETLCAQLFTTARAQRFRPLDRTCTVVGCREPWFDKHCYKARHDFHCAQGNLDNFLTHRFAYYNLCKQKKSACIGKAKLKLCHDAEINSSNFWFSILSVDSNPVYLISMNEWHRFKSNLHKATDSNCDARLTHDGPVDDLFNASITQDKVSLAISCSARGKAVRLDGITNKIFMQSVNLFTLLLTTLFNIISLTIWLQAVIISIFKADARDDPSNYRFISLLCALQYISGYTVVYILYYITYCIA